MTLAGKSDKPRLTKGERTRQRLLDAAEEVFGEQTYHEAALVDITKRAKVASGTFYVYFDSKLEIFRELVRTFRRDLRAELSDATAGLRHRVDIEREGLRAFLDYLSRHPNLYRILRNAEFVDREVYLSWYREFSGAISHGLAIAMGRGEIAAGDAQVLAYCIMGIGDFLGARLVIDRQGESFDDLDDRLQTAFEFMSRGLGAGVRADSAEPATAS